MSTIFGEAGSVKFGAGVVAEIKNFKLNQSAAMLDAHVMGSGGWDKKKTGLKNWSVDLECLYDPSDATGQLSVRVGDEIAAVEMYPEGDTTGLEFFSGAGIVETVDYTVAHDGLIEYTMKIMGNGALTPADVA